MKITMYMLDEFSVPEHIVSELVSKYMEYVTEPKPFVMQAHYIGDSEHVDFRFKVNGFLEGWSIVGASRDDPHTPQKFLENIGKGFRAETKCPNPYCDEWKYEIVRFDEANKIIYVRYLSEEELREIFNEFRRVTIGFLKYDIEWSKKISLRLQEPGSSSSERTKYIS